MNYPERPLGEVLTPAASAERKRDDQRYGITGIYSFGKGLIRRPEIGGSETAYPSLHRLSAGQVVMSKLNAWEGAIAFVDESFDGTYVSPEYPVFDVITEMGDARYLAHLLAWPRLWRQLTPRGSMVRRKRTTPTTFLQTRVPIPDIAEQRRVASRIDGAMAKLGRISELREQLSKIRIGLLESLFAHVQSAHPRQMKDLVDLERVPAELHEAERYVQIGIRSFGRGIFHRPAVGPGELSKLNYFRIFPNRLVVSNIMAWEGAIALSGPTDEGCIGSHRFLSFAPRDTVDPAYLNYFFQTKKGHLLISEASTGTVKRNQTLSIRDFERITIPLPLIDQQKKIVRMLDLSSLQVDRAAKQQSQAVTDTRLSLLNAAFTGRL